MTALGIVLALAAGVVSFASPCCLPLVPGYVSYLLGSAAAGEGSLPVAAPRERRTTLSHALLFVAGFTAVFVSLWASVGLVGYLLRDQVGLLRVVGGAVLVLMGLHVAGLLELSVLYRDVRLPVHRLFGLPTRPRGGSGPRYGRSLLLGVVFAAGWTPCVGPILGGIIALASTGDSVAAGTALLLAYALGLGIPFVLVALGVDEVSRRLGWLRRHHVGVGLVTGAALALTGFLMMTGLFVQLSGALPDISL